MAKYKAEIPYDMLKQFEELSQGTMLEEMVRVGARVVYNNLISNLNKSFKTSKSLRKGLKVSRVYNTPSDDGVNVHIGFYGYDDDGTPIPLKALAREYGTSRGEKKKPFMRKAFKKAEIEQVMMEVQRKYMGDSE